jgi:hypothetical protein
VHPGRRRAHVPRQQLPLAQSAERWASTSPSKCCP